MNNFADSQAPLSGADLCILRVRQGKKAKDVASAVGMSASYYSEIEKGKKPVPSSSEFLRKWLEAVEVTFEEVKNGQLKPKPPEEDHRREEQWENWRTLAESLMSEMTEEQIIEMIKKWLDEYERDVADVEALFRCKHAIQFLLRRRMLS